MALTTQALSALRAKIAAALAPMSALVRPVKWTSYEDSQELNVPAPLLMDQFGRLFVYTTRRVPFVLPDLTIKVGSQVSDWQPITPEIINSQMFISYDADGRLAAEAINLEVAVVQNPDATAASPDARVVSTNIHGAVLAVANQNSQQLAGALWYRFKSAVAVTGAARVFRLRLLL